MKGRKIFLIAADVVLLAVCIFQWIAAAKDNVKTFEFKEDADELTVEGSFGSYTLSKQGDEWFIGEKKFPANAGSVDVMVSAVESIRALDKMGRASNETVSARYDLTDSKAIKVTVKAQGKVVRSLNIGKESSTGTQCYVTVDGGDDIYLIASNLMNTFNKTVDDLRSKTVYQVESETITSIAVSDADSDNWTVSRFGNGEDVVWSVSGVNVEVDSDKAADWFKNMSSLVTTKWYDENYKGGGEKLSSFRISTISKTISVDVYRVPAENADAKDSYYAKCSESPYYFEVPSYSVQKFQKTASDIAK